MESSNLDISARRWRSPSNLWERVYSGMGLSLATMLNPWFEGQRDPSSTPTRRGRLSGLGRGVQIVHGPCKYFTVNNLDLILPVLKQPKSLDDHRKNMVIPMSIENEPFAGKWRFNAKLSNICAPTPESWIKEISAGPEGLAVREEIVRLDGTEFVRGVRARFDGADYPVEGGRVVDTIAYTRTN